VLGGLLGGASSSDVTMRETCERFGEEPSSCGNRGQMHAALSEGALLIQGSLKAEGLGHG
jgi:hypothetical protein